MKSVLIPEVGRAELVEVPTPSPSHGEALVRILATGICGSDVHGFRGEHAFRVPPVITGHEAVGEIVALEGDSEGLSVGDMVAVEPQVGCTDCDFCRSGNYHLCRNKRVLGTPDWPGSFAEYITAPFPCLYPVPGSYDTELAAFVEPLAVGVHSVRRAAAGEGDRFAVFGAGTIGLMHVMALSVLSPAVLACTDIKSRNLEVARAVGATDTINPLEQDAVEVIDQITDGSGVDACFAVFHTSAVIDAAVRAVRALGKVVVVAHIHGPVEAPLGVVQLNEIEMIGTVMYTREDYLRTIDLAAQLGDSLRGLITHRITLSELPQYLSRLASGDLPDAIKVMVRMT